jgi:two-component system sensor histidine kinase HydH
VESEKLATAGQMAAGLAHEIRNPLTSIKMLGQVLRSRMKNQPEDQKTLDGLVKEIDRLDRTIQEFINRAMPGELSLTKGDINREVREVIGVAEESLAAKDIVVHQDLSDDIPTISMDREKTKQVLWNLVLNAKEAMPKGGKLTVATKRVDKQFVEISVEDSGHGIADGEPEQLFQPFFTTKPEGVGLGLTMSRKIIEKHGGELFLENRPQGGIRARVLLPMETR